MSARVDPLGRLLLRSGAISEAALADVLDNQRHTLPFASLAYVLGHADEEALVRALSRQWGVPGIVMDRSVIRLDVLDGIQIEHALRYGVLPVYEDERRLFIATENPEVGREILRELEFVKGKAVVQHIALHITLARTIRAAYRALGHGQTHCVGAFAERTATTEHGAMYVVSDVDTIPSDAPAARAHEVVVGDITKEIIDNDLLEIIDRDEEASTVDGARDVSLYDTDVSTTHSGSPTETTTASGGRETPTPLSQVEIQPRAPTHALDLDDGDGVEPGPAHGGPARVLIVDDDFATRHLLVKELQPLGYVTATASSGGEGVRMIKSDPPDLVVVDVMLPQIDGFQICRAIKQSRRYHHIPVVLMSAVIDSGRVTDDVLRRYGADAYFEKPLNTERVCRRISELLGEARERAASESEDGTFDEALALYRDGDVDGAVRALRKGLEHDPLSAKHHFVLANLLQKQSMLYEAIDEYEATVDLKPDYFPALTRLAYLYYKKGFSAKAIETWRRSLPHCPDPSLRQNIEVFMRKLIADMQSEL